MSAAHTCSSSRGNSSPSFSLGPPALFLRRTTTSTSTGRSLAVLRALLHTVQGSSLKGFSTRPLQGLSKLPFSTKAKSSSLTHSLQACPNRRFPQKPKAQKLSVCVGIRHSSSFLGTRPPSQVPLVRACASRARATLAARALYFLQAASSRPRHCFHAPALGGKSLRGFAAPPFFPEEIVLTRSVGCGRVVASLKGVVSRIMGAWQDASVAPMRMAWWSKMASLWCWRVV